MDFDCVSCEYREPWNAQAALRIPCLFSLQSKSIYPPLQQIWIRFLDGSKCDIRGSVWGSGSRIALKATSVSYIATWYISQRPEWQRDHLSDQIVFFQFPIDSCSIDAQYFSGLSDIILCRFQSADKRLLLDLFKGEDSGRLEV
jgi:hypothetical protein